MKWWRRKKNQQGYFNLPLGSLPYSSIITSVLARNPRKVYHYVINPQNLQDKLIETDSRQLFASGYDPRRWTMKRLGWERYQLSSVASAG